MPTLQFTDGKELSLGTFYCIGRNYAAHAKEMGSALPAAPIVFLKPPAAFLASGSNLEIPPFSTELHHEVELVVVIGDNADFVQPSSAASLIAGYTVGLDMTLRDVQRRAKEQGEPWSVSKAFRGSAPLSKVIPATLLAQAPEFELALSVNGSMRQRGNTAQMERSIPELVSYVASVFGLRTGDCIFTGTPSGVGPVTRGDRLQGSATADTGETVTVELQIK